jgi:hypothetical protein
LTGERTDRLLSGVPGPTRAAILGALSTGFRTPRALDLPEPLYVDVQARLGRIQRNANEAYVPLVCEHLSLAVRRSPAPSRERDVHVIVVPRAAVEASSQARTLGAIHRWVASHRDPRDAARRLTLRFSGYERDPRELWQIDAVRAFVAGVDRAFPFWFYVAELDTDFLKVLAFCLCRSSVARSGVTELNGDDFGKFLAVHFAALNQLMSEWGLSESETRRISDEVVTYFETSRRKP